MEKDKWIASVLQELQTHKTSFYNHMQLLTPANCKQFGIIAPILTGINFQICLDFGSAPIQEAG